MTPSPVGPDRNGSQIVEADIDYLNGVDTGGRRANGAAQNAVVAALTIGHTRFRQLVKTIHPAQSPLDY